MLEKPFSIRSAVLQCVIVSSKKMYQYIYNILHISIVDSSAPIGETSVGSDFSDEALFYEHGFPTEIRCMAGAAVDAISVSYGANDGPLHGATQTGAEPVTYTIPAGKFVNKMEGNI